MTPGIRIIRLGGVNCYLIAADDGFVLIDSGTPEKREALDAELTSAGCRPGSLRLVVLTHGDYDHAGNAAHLRDKYGTRIAMHRDDSGRVERADWTWNLKPKPDKFGLLLRVVALGVLLIFSLVFAGWVQARRHHPARRMPGVLTARHLLVLVAAVATATFLVRLVFPFGSESVTDLNLWEWPACFALFVLGITASRQGWLTAVPDRLRTQSRTTTLVAALLTAVFVASADVR